MSSRRRVPRKMSGNNKDVALSISGGRREVIGTPTSQEGIEWTGGYWKSRAPSHDHAALDKP